MERHDPINCTEHKLRLFFYELAKMKRQPKVSKVFITLLITMYVLRYDHIFIEILRRLWVVTSMLFKFQILSTSFSRN